MTTNNELAFVFPGQGSQHPGMLAEAADAYPILAETFAEASEALGFDLWKLAAEGPEAEQNLTENTQPLILTASVALWRVWMARTDERPALMAGHSLGEFSALVCAGALPFAATVDLVRQRGQFMQSAVPVGEGAMAAIIGLDDNAIDKACADAAQGEVVSAVNYNSPGQVVIAGHVAAVERAGEACKAAGAKRALPLPVSAPFHTSLMQPAGEQLKHALNEIDVRSPEIPVIHNVSKASESDPALIRQLLVEQISQPVPWVACVQSLQAKGITRVIECGPGKVLTGLAKRIDRSLSGANLQAPSDFDNLIV